MPGKTPYFRCATGMFEPESPCADVSVGKLILETTILMSLQCEMEHMVNDTRNSIATGHTRICPLEQHAQFNKEIIKHKTEKSILFEQYDSGKIDSLRFFAKNQEISMRINNLYEKQKVLKKEFQKPQNIKATKTEAPDRYNAPQSLSREILTMLVKEIYIFPDDRMEIVWDFCDTN